LHLIFNEDEKNKHYQRCTPCLFTCDECDWLAQNAAYQLGSILPYNRPYFRSDLLVAVCSDKAVQVAGEGEKRKGEG
jgi:hypothetical protein